jgi:hypothetical protein
MRRKTQSSAIVVCLLCVVFTVPGVAQFRREQPEVSYPPQLLSELAKVRDAALASNYAYQQVAHLTENIGPRMAGSPQAEHAAQYITGELRKLGLEVKLEEVRVPRWLRGAESAELVEYPGQAPGTSQKIVVTTLSGSSATPTEGITAEVVVVRSREELKRAAELTTAFPTRVTALPPGFHKAQLPPKTLI